MGFRRIFLLSPGFVALGNPGLDVLGYCFQSTNSFECFSVLANFFVLFFLGFIFRVFSKLRFDDGLEGFSNRLLLNYIML